MYKLGMSVCSFVLVVRSLSGSMKSTPHRISGTDESIAHVELDTTGLCERTVSLYNFSGKVRLFPSDVIVAL